MSYALIHKEKEKKKQKKKKEITSTLIKCVN